MWHRISLNPTAIATEWIVVFAWVALAICTTFMPVHADSENPGSVPAPSVNQHGLTPEEEVALKELLARMEEAGIKDKVAPPIRLVLARMQVLKVTRQNVQSLDIADRLSSLLVRVDQEGRIQVYVRYRDEHGERIAQEWVPFDEILPLAGKQNVVRIECVSYGTSRAAHSK